MNIFELVGSIRLDDAGVESKLKKYDSQASGVSKSMGLSFGSIAGAALKAAAVLGAGMGIKEIIAASAKSEKTLAQMDAVLKSTGGSAGMTKTALIAYADAQSKVTTFSKGTVEAGENLMLTFTGIGKKAFPDAMTAAQNMSTAMGTDLNSSVMMLGKSLNDPITGMSKLTKSGVTFTAAQKEQITAMAKAGNTAGAQALMLKELQKEFGGSAVAAGKTFGGALTILRNQMTGVGVSIGNTVLPYMNSFIKVITANMPKIKQTITDVINTVVPKFKEWVTILGQIVSELFPNFGKQVDAVKGKASGLGGTLDIVSKALGFVRDNIGFVKVVLETLGGIWLINQGYLLVTNGLLIIHNAITAVTATASWLAAAGSTAFGVALTVATGPIGIIIAALVVLGLGIYEIVKHWDVIKAKTQEVWNIISTFLSTTFGNIGSTVSKVFGNIGKFLGTTWDSIKSTISIVWNGIKSFLSTTFGNIWTTISTIFGNIGRFLGTTWDTIKTKVSTTVASIVQNIKDGFKNIPGDILKVGEDIINNLKQGIQNKINDIKSKVADVVNAITGKFKELFGIHSPSKVMQSIGQFLTMGLIKGLSAKDIGEHVSGLISGMKGDFNAIKGFFNNIGSSISGGGSAQVAGWLKQAMAITGTGMENFNGLMTMINAESTFNPNAINLTDSNARAGHPSRGLLQTIPTTFEQWRNKSLPDNIVDPIANLVAGINYMVGRYGSVQNAPGLRSLRNGGGYVGYAVGSRYIGSDQIAQVHQGEMIVPKSENPYANSGGKILPNTGLTLTITNFYNNSKDDIKQLADELAFYVNSKSKALGGN